MNANAISAIVIAVVGAATAIFQARRGHRGLRGQIEKDLELLSNLPSGSTAAQPLADRIDKSVLRLLDEEEDLRRDPAGVAVAIVLFVIGGALIAAGVHYRGSVSYT